MFKAGWPLAYVQEMLRKRLRNSSENNEARMTWTVLPVPCPKCGEAQNTTPGDFDPNDVPFGPVNCMVCGYEFMQLEYLQRLKTRRREHGLE